MTQADTTSPPMTHGARQLVEAAVQRQTAGRHPVLGVHHWLLALVEQYGAMAEALAQGLEPAGVQRALRERLSRGETGAALDQATLVGRAWERAQAHGKGRVAERDLAAAILAAAGYPLRDAPPPLAQRPAAGQPAADQPTPSYQPMATRPTPALDQFGRDLTRAALDGRLRPVVGRDNEIELVIETLCRRTKRNPVLVGPAGVGKTAIVEGFAQRIVRGAVPAILQGVRVVELQPSVLVAGAHLVGELEKRMQAVLGEANQAGIILFVDEMHAMVGAGGTTGTSDMASLLKPALARGDLACIAATTDDEYRRFIEPDGALERRFQPVRVQELSPEQTLTVLLSLRDDLARVRGVQIDDAIVRWLIEFARRFLQNRHFPDKAVDLLEQCVAYALTRGQTALTLADAEAVAQRMVGMPVAVEAGLAALRARLAERALLTEAHAVALVDRLAVTLRGLDLRQARPNAIVLLAGPAAGQAEALAETIAATLLGAAERVVTIDLSALVHPADVSRLVGAPPGYIGHAEPSPLHRVTQMPWCVLRLEHLHACHPQVREVIARALAAGSLTDGRGRRIYLSDTIVLLTADLGQAAPRPLGFQPAGDADDAPARQLRPAAEQALGADLVAQVDLICAEAAATPDARRRWLQQHLLAHLAERYRDQGLQVQWDASLIDWMLAQQAAAPAARDWERLVDEQLSPRLIRYLPAAGAGQARSLLVSYRGDGIHVDMQ
jgi:ATP-dependent Clp protease ATP-binding subunit ClpC